MTTVATGRTGTDKQPGKQASAGQRIETDIIGSDDPETVVECTVALVKHIGVDGITLQGLCDASKYMNVPVIKKVALACINIPKMGLPGRKSPNGTEIEATPNEPYAIEAREFLRITLVGQTVSFVPTFVIPGSGKVLGMMCLGRDWDMDIASQLVARGLASVRSSNDVFAKMLTEVEQTARQHNVGMWSNTPKSNSFPRDLNVHDYLGKKLMGVVEHVRDGSNLKVSVLPDFEQLNVSLAGVVCADGSFGDQARLFTEARLLQREVEVIVHLPANIPGCAHVTLLTIPEGDEDAKDIAVYLLCNGLARVSKWSLGPVPKQEMYLRAEAVAKNQKVGFWAECTSGKLTSTSSGNSSNDYDATVLYVNGAEMIQVFRLHDKRTVAVHLSSIKVIRLPENVVAKRESPLQLQVPFEVREFLRKWLIGKRVHVNLDYVYKLPRGGDQRYCSTVTVDFAPPESNQEVPTADKTGPWNVAVELIKRSYATLVRYRNDDPNRSCAYSELIQADTNRELLEKPGKKPVASPAPNVVDLTGEAARARLGLFKQQKTIPAIVEWVISGVRFRLLAESTAMMTFSLAAVMCPRSDNPDPELAEIGAQALHFSRTVCLQREVTVQVTAMDRSGNCFTGSLILNGYREHGGVLSLMLLERGFASLHPGSAMSQQRSNPSLHAKMVEIEETARNAKKGLWATKAMQPKDEEEEEDKSSDENETLVAGCKPGGASSGNTSSVARDNFKPLATFKGFLSYADLKSNVYLQDMKVIPMAEEALTEMGKLMIARPPLKETPKRGQILAVNTGPGSWSRASISAINGDEFDLCLIDTGAEIEHVPLSKLRLIPSDCKASRMPSLARQVRLAFLRRVADEEANHNVQAYFAEASNSELQFDVSVMYTMAGIDYVVLTDPDGCDVNKKFIAAGNSALVKMLSVPKRLRNCGIIATYAREEGEARKERLGVWRYGNWVQDLDEADSGDEEQLRRGR